MKIFHKLIIKNLVDSLSKLIERPHGHIIVRKMILHTRIEIENSVKLDMNAISVDNNLNIDDLSAVNLNDLTAIHYISLICKLGESIKKLKEKNAGIFRIILPNLDPIINSVKSIADLCKKYSVWNKEYNTNDAVCIAQYGLLSYLINETCSYATPSSGYAKAGRSSEISLQKLEVLQRVEIGLSLIASGNLSTSSQLILYLKDIQSLASSSQVKELNKSGQFFTSILGCEVHLSTTPSKVHKALKSIQSIVNKINYSKDRSFEVSKDQQTSDGVTNVPSKLIDNKSQFFDDKNNTQGDRMSINSLAL